MNSRSDEHFTPSAVIKTEFRCRVQPREFSQLVNSSTVLKLSSYNLTKGGFHFKQKHKDKPNHLRGQIEASIMLEH